MFVISYGFEQDMNFEAVFVNLVTYITTVWVAWVRDICGFPLFGISPAAGLLIELLEKFKNNAIANSRIGKNKSQKNCTFDLSFCSLPDGR